MPVVPSCILDPFRTQFLALLPERVVTHPLGCHRRRRATAGWLWFPTATAALARGLSGDQRGFRLWRERMAELAGPRNAFQLRTASSAHIYFWLRPGAWCTGSDL